MILDLDTATGGEVDAPDVCVIGAGAVGTTLAAELVSRGRRVLLLEGGGRTVEGASQALYDSEVVGLPHDGIHDGRYRVFGGTTTKWGGQILEFDEADFLAHPWIPGSGWPFSKRELVPYYQRALIAEGLTGVEASDEAVWRSLGSDPPSLPDFASFFTRWAREPDFSVLHGPALEASDRVAVYLHANCVQLIMDEAGRRLHRVRCRALSGKEVEFEADRFVLCLGGIETVRLLLQPDSRGPWTDNPLLGRHFQDHVSAVCGSVTDFDPRLLQRYFSNAYLKRWKYMPMLKLSFEARRREKLLNVASAVLFSDDDEVAVARLKAAAGRLRRGRAEGMADLRALTSQLPLLAKHVWRLKREGRAYHAPSAGVKLGLMCEQEPLSDSRIQLARGRDALGLVRVALDWRISESEIKTLRRCALAVERAFRERQIAVVTPDPDLLSEPDKFVEACDDNNHHMGGLRMADDTTCGVVDSGLRLHGTENAFVCSSAVFPTSSASNPTHTLMALTLRLADALTGEG